MPTRKFRMLKEGCMLGPYVRTLYAASDMFTIVQEKQDQADIMSRCCGIRYLSFFSQIMFYMSTS